ncbi:hypothetical protein Tco_0576199 [Tanacetum coccineum]
MTSVCGRTKGKFDGKADEGFFVGYSINSKSFRVFNSRTRIVEENLYVQFIVEGNQSNGNAGTKACEMPGDDEKKVTKEPGKEGGDPSKEDERDDQEKEDNVNNTNNVNAASTNEVNAIGGKSSIALPDDPNMPDLEDIVYSDDDEDVGAKADMNNLDAFMLMQATYGNSKSFCSWVKLSDQLIGSLMYLTSSRPDIMFAICACARYQVNPKISHLHAMKRIFRYLKGQPKLGLWYPKDSPFDLVAYTNSDYAGASLDRKSTTRGC